MDGTPSFLSVATQAENDFHTSSADYVSILASLRNIQMNLDGQDATAAALSANIALSEHLQNIHSSADTEVTVNNLLEKYAKLLMPTVKAEEVIFLDTISSDSTFSEANSRLLFNIASILFYYHQHKECQKITIRLLSLASSEEDVGFFTKLCFLHMEVLIQLFKHQFFSRVKLQVLFGEVEAKYATHCAKHVEDKINGISQEDMRQSCVSLDALSGILCKHRFLVYKNRVSILLAGGSGGESTTINLRTSEVDALANITSRLWQMMAPQFKFDARKSAEDTNRNSSNGHHGNNNSYMYGHSNNNNIISSNGSTSATAGNDWGNHDDSSSTVAGGGPVLPTLDSLLPLDDNYIGIQFRILRQLMRGTIVEAERGYRSGNSAGAMTLLNMSMTCPELFSIRNLNFNGPVDPKEQLRYILTEGQQSLQMFVQNNRGVVHLRARQYNLATLSLHRALCNERQLGLSCERAKAERAGGGAAAGKATAASSGAGGVNPNSPPNLHHEMLHETLFRTKCVKPSICYNLGLALLKSNRPVEAMQQFRNALSGSARILPYIWIRMAECCIAIDNEVIGYSTEQHSGGGGSGDSNNNDNNNSIASTAMNAGANVDSLRATGAREGGGANGGESTKRGPVSMMSKKRSRRIVVDWTKSLGDDVSVPEASNIRGLKSYKTVLAEDPAALGLSVTAATSEVAVAPRISAVTDESIDDDAAAVPSSLDQACTMHQATKYLNCALSIIFVMLQALLKESSESIGTGGAQVQARIKHYQSLDDSVTIKLVYVLVRCGDMHSALHHIRILLGRESVVVTNEQQRFLVYSYYTEVLCRLGLDSTALDFVSANRAVMFSPQSVMQSFNGGMAAMKATKFSAADMANISWLINTANVLMLNKRFADAMSVLQNANKTYPNCAPIARSLSYAFLKKGKKAEAVALFREHGYLS